MRPLIAFLTLLAAGPAAAGPVFFSPQYQQCDPSGTVYATGSTREAHPTIRVQIQDNSDAAGLKTGQQVPDFFAFTRIGLRSEDSYRVDASSCITTGVPAACGGAAACQVTTYRYADTSSMSSDRGLLGAYYSWSSNPQSSTMTFDWAVQQIEIDGPIDFNTTSATFPPSPIGPSKKTGFSARWSGYVVPPATDNYTFSFTTDDGARLYVNGVNLIESFVDQAATQHDALVAVPMLVGQPYEIVLEYYNDAGAGAIKLQWKGTGAPIGTALVDVAAQYLRPQLVSTIGTCVSTSTVDCLHLGQVNSLSRQPIGGSCGAANNPPAFAAAAAGIPWASYAGAQAPVNAAPYNAANRAFAFNGSSDYMQFSGQAQWDVPPSYTVSAWVKPGNCTGAQRILSQQGDGRFWLFRLNGCQIDAEDSREGGGATPGAHGAAVPLDGQWHYVAAVRINGSAWNYYLDGANVYTTTALSTTTMQMDATNAGVSAFVSSIGGTSEFFNGAIDELRLYPGALQSDTILMEYSAQAYKYAANGVNFGISTAPYSTGGANGTTNPVTIAVGTATAGAGLIFVASSADGINTAETSQISVNIDKTTPAAPTLVPTPMTTNSIKWAFTSTKICHDGTNDVYHLIDPATNTEILPTNPAGVQTYTEAYADPTPNVLHGRMGTDSDVWGTSSLGSATTAYTLAADPTGLTASAVTPTSITLTWNTNLNPGYTRYELSMSQNNFTAPTDVSTPIVISANFTSNSFAVNNLNPGSPYYFRVRAANGRSSDAFGGVFSNFSTFSTFTTPNSPLALGIPRSNTQIDWTWKDIQGATSYNLYSAGAATPFTVVPSPGAPGTDVFFSSTALLTNTLYSLEVAAVNAGGAGPRSPTSNAYTLALPPAAIAATAVTTNTVTLQWDAGAVGPLANPGYTFYEVNVASDPLFAIVVSTKTSPQLTLTVGSLLPASTYYARVRAYSGAQSTTTFDGAGPAKFVTNPDPNVSMSTAPPSEYVPPGGVVGVWQFDEGASTTAFDGTTYGDNGVLTCVSPGCVSTPTWTTGPPNLNFAANLTGQTSSLVLINDPGIFAFTDSLTVAAWINPATSALPNGAAIVAKGVLGGEAFSLDVTGSRVRFLARPGQSITANQLVDVGRWHRVVAVYDGVTTNATLYIDNVVVAGPTALGGPRLAPLCGAVNCPVTIGNRRSSNGSNPAFPTAYDLGFNGAIDSVLIVHRALSASEVAMDYQGAQVNTTTLPPPNNRVQLTLPPNAFGGSALIYASNDPLHHPIRIDQPTLTSGLLSEPTGQALINGSLIEIVPTVAGLPYTLPLGSSATIALPYSDSRNSGLVDGTNPPISVNTLVVYTLDPTVIKWNALPSVVDTVNHLVRATTPHFSVFGLFGATTIGATLDQARVYPKPWIVGSTGRFGAANLTFDNLPANGEIRIFNLAGERVVVLPFSSNNAGKVLWNGNNLNGLPAVSGLYFAYIKNSDNNATTVAKFVIER